MIKFTLVSILFAVGYIINTYFTNFLMARYMMVLAICLFISQLFAFKKGVISLRVACHSFVSVCWMIVFILALVSGGIHSFVLPWLTLIPIVGLLLLGFRAAWGWGLVGFLSVILFSLINEKNYLPPHLIMEQNALLIASLLIGLQLIILILTYIFDRQQHLLVSKIESNNQELYITQQQIAEQRDLVALHNQRLKEAQEIIESQNLELLNRNEGLEAEIEKRTRELMDYNQQLEQFAFIASHNLRAPIARILGLGNLLKVSNEPADEIPIKQSLINAAIELDHIVKDINTILRIRKNNETIFEDLDIKKEVEMILSSLSKDIESTDAVIEIKIENDKIRTVRPYFNSIVYNLLSNAIKYRKLNEKPDIVLKIAREENYTCIMVRDNGLGFEPDVIKDKLFTLYSRFHDHVEGKGIGLYLIKTQAEILNGYVEVESQEGVGSEFRVFIKTEQLR